MLDFALTDGAKYYADNAAVWYQTMGSAASVVLNWMSDAFLVGPLPNPSVS